MKKILCFLLLIMMFTLPVYSEEKVKEDQLEINEIVTDHFTDGIHSYHYYITLEQSGVLELRFNEDGYVPMVSIFDENNKIIEGPSYNKYVETKRLPTQFQVTLSKGSYMIELKAYEQPDSMSDYRDFSFKVNFEVMNETFEEYYGFVQTLDNAYEIKANQMIEGCIGNDRDYFKFTLEKSGFVEFMHDDLNFYSNANNCKIEIYDQNKELLWSDYRFARNYYFNKGTYYIGIIGQKNNYSYEYIDGDRENIYRTIMKPNTTSYAFYFDVKKTNETVDEQLNTYYSKETAANIQITPNFQTIIGQLSLGDSCDYYRFSVDCDMYLKINNISEDADFRIEFPGSNYFYVNKGEELLIHKGTYYIKVYGEHRYGTYRFDMKARIPFEDVESNLWYYDTVKKIYGKGLMTGTKEHLFEPDKEMSRAMVAKVFHRMSNEKDVYYKEVFDDVANHLWYTQAIIWCSNQGIVNGYGNHQFGPDDAITREQMAAMCYNYAKYIKKRVPLMTTSIKHFKDYKQVSSNMETVMKWAVACGIVSGTQDGYLKPLATASRAECAKMLNQLEEVLKW